MDFLELQQNIIKTVIKERFFFNFQEAHTNTLSSMKSHTLWGSFKKIRIMRKFIIKNINSICSKFILTFEKFDICYKKYCYINFGKKKPKDTEKIENI